MAVEGARDDERGPHDRSASLVPYQGGPEPHTGGTALSALPGGDLNGAGGEGRRGRAALWRAGGRRARVFLHAVAERIIETAPRVPVRDLETLRTQFPGLGTEELAEKLVAGATKGSATVGAGVGAAAMLPVPPAMPAELAAEIVGVAGVELKLIAELHEVYGRRAPGNARERATAYLGSWASERGIELTRPATVSVAMGGELRSRLRQQITKRTLRNLPNLTPFLIGAAVGAFANHRETAKLAERIRADLRTGRPPGA
ncbi:hypothetical protein [Streptomyces sp. 891-h]|uniref:hypothetical protein n=1 Tax=Streptomyces sp. 891-h TaxID=2720714 RepID=UPI001FAA4FCF|nr:hypothetical protein [Streptomyces sp. 891-h]UNZ16966.1 hypothetical protein HC362_07670 [Streptomyces sp. 891-h]